MKPIWLAALCAACTVFPALADDPSFDERREQIDAAVERGLRFLADRQKPDGSFDGQHGNTTALPALAGMAFLSKGYLPDQPPFGDAINRSVDYVLDHVERNNKSREGYFGQIGDGKMYAHSISTLFLSEVSGMVDAKRQARIDEILPLATKLILDAQNRQKSPDETGGWRYTPESGDSDLSCSGWALMALRSVRLNGGSVPPEAIEKAVAYIRRNQEEHTGDRFGSFFYKRNQREFHDTLTGAAILCLELCGRHEDPASLRAAEYLMKIYQNRYKSGWGNFYLFYGMYYSAQGLFQIGGESWKEFYAWMCDTWIPRQNEDGSWVNRENGNEGNPAYCTSMMVLALTVPYRMLPIYQRDETVDED